MLPRARLHDSMILVTTQLHVAPTLQKYSYFKQIEVFRRMMKNSTFSKFKRTKSSKPARTKKKVHWSKQLEEIFFFNPEPENSVPADDLRFAEIHNSAPENQPTTELQIKTATITPDETFALQRRLEKMALENEVAYFSTDNCKQLSWRRIVDVENESIGDWV